MKQAKPVRTRSVSSAHSFNNARNVNNIRNVNSGRNVSNVSNLNHVNSRNRVFTTEQRNQIALISAVLFVIAALLSLLVAWSDLRTGGTSETLI
ncbi:hypothetical protein G8C92_15170 [Paenibacillus donghaensis]|uniref:hypothetical protein n=1 Tax=Paenibacillus donghaensis TaxID=414771 RepID=UPI001883205E|nr:hypothetical protein [Paenibacillus donghaensis]MBE9915361.1 hypothetical protein [Paenibacillus donghaensis]